MSISLSLIDLSKAKQVIRKKLTEVCKADDYINKFSTVNEFFNSTSWKNMRDSDPCTAHSFANDYLTTMFDPNEFAIYDNGAALYDKGNIISNLTQVQKNSLDKIDSSKASGMYKSNGLTMMYIGSTAVFSSNNSNGVVDELNLQIVGDGPYDLQAYIYQPSNKMGNKGSDKWVTVATLSYSVSNSETTNQPIIELIVTAVPGPTLTAPGTYIMDIPNFYTLNGNTYSLTNQTINSGNGVVYNIIYTSLSIILPDTEVSIESGNYYLEYTKDT